MAAVDSGGPDVCRDVRLTGPLLDGCPVFVLYALCSLWFRALAQEGQICGNLKCWKKSEKFGYIQIIR